MKASPYPTHNQPPEEGFLLHQTKQLNRLYWVPPEEMHTILVKDSSLLADGEETPVGSFPDSIKAFELTQTATLEKQMEGMSITKDGQLICNTERQTVQVAAGSFLLPQGQCKIDETKHHICTALNWIDFRTQFVIRLSPKQATADNQNSSKAKDASTK